MRVGVVTEANHRRDVPVFFARAGTDPESRAAHRTPRGGALCPACHPQEYAKHAARHRRVQLQGSSS